MVGDITRGARVYLEGPHQLKEGEYMRWDEHGWYACCPGPGELTANLNSHKVVEHEDGTITVSPSILCSNGPKLGNVWHGFLEKGIWREV